MRKPVVMRDGKGRGLVLDSVPQGAQETMTVAVEWLPIPRVGLAALEQAGNVPSTLESAAIEPQTGGGMLAITHELNPTVGCALLHPGQEVEVAD